MSDQTSQTMADQPQTTQQPSIEDMLKGITREDGSQKYQSAEDALKALSHSQEHIKRLEADLAKYREEQQKLNSEYQKDRDVLSEFKNQFESSMKQEQSQAVSPVDPEQLMNKAREEALKALEEQKIKDAQQANLNHVISSLKTTYGSNWGDALSSRLNELGMTVDMFRANVFASPQAALALVSPKVSQPTNPTISTYSALSQQVDNSQSDAKYGKSEITGRDYPDLEKLFHETADLILEADKEGFDYVTEMSKPHNFERHFVHK